MNFPRYRQGNGEILNFTVGTAVRGVGGTRTCHTPAWLGGCNPSSRSIRQWANA